MTRDPISEYALRLGDNCLILAQRVSEWAGHGPVLEEDIALANVALDMIGQAQLWLELAGEGEGLGPDDLAFGRDASDFRNILLVEQPNGDFAHTIVRSFLFDAWHYYVLTYLAGSSDDRVAAIAEKAVKEVSYHLSRTTDLVKSLGDGTEESRSRMQGAIDDLWPFTGEMFMSDDVDDALQASSVAPDLQEIRGAWDALVGQTLALGDLDRPEDGYMQKGGKRGIHSEQLGFLLAEMQFLQRAYPGATW